MECVARTVISLDILKDGFTNLKHSVTDLMDTRPTTVEHEQPDTAQERVQQELERLDWVQAAHVRLREEGDVLCGEAFVVPRDDHDLMDRLKQAQHIAIHSNWRMYDLVIMPVRTLRPEPAPGD